MSERRAILVGTITAVTLTLAACSSQPQEGAGATATPAASQPQAAPAQAKRFDLKGKVVSVDKAGKKVVVDNEDIPGFMSAMTMPYAVKDEHLLDNLAPGAQITAKVVSTGGEFWLEDVAVVRAEAPK